MGSDAWNEGFTNDVFKPKTNDMEISGDNEGKIEGKRGFSGIISATPKIMKWLNIHRIRCLFRYGL